MGNELVVFRKAGFPALDMTSPQMRALKANLNGEALKLTDLQRAKMPSGGGSSWEIDGINGAESVKEVTGILLHMEKRRTLWESSDPSGKMPVCTSNDLIHGAITKNLDDGSDNLPENILKLGMPGGGKGLCDACAHNVFGTSTRSDGSKGRGKRCKESRLWFLLRTGDTTPLIVPIPPSSIKPTTIFVKRLPVAHFRAVVTIGLKKIEAVQGKHPAYSEVFPVYAGAIPVEEEEAIVAYARALGALFAAATVLDEDVCEAAGEDLEKFDGQTLDVPPAGGEGKKEGAL